MCLPSVLPKLPGDEEDGAAPDGPQEELGLGRDEAGMRGRLASGIESSREAILKLMLALVQARLSEAGRQEEPAEREGGQESS